MFKFLHAADIHLDSPMHGLETYESAPVEELRGATRRALENLVQLAVSENVAFVLIAGDLYDGEWKDYNTGLYLTSRLSQLREAGIPVFIIAGNHDAASRITKVLRLPEGTFLFPSEAPRTFHMDGLDVAIHGQSFSAPAIKKDLSSGYPPPVPGCFNIGLLHTCVTGRVDHAPYAPCKVEDLVAKGYEYWALGHVHKMEVLSEDPFIGFSGNIQGRHIKETGPKGCMLVSVDERGRPRADFKPLDVVRWYRVILADVDTASPYQVVDRVTEKISELLEKNPGLFLVVRAELRGLGEAMDEIAAEPEHWLAEVRSAIADSSGGRVWLEKLKISLLEPPDVQMEKGPEDPLAEILGYLEDMRQDQRQLNNLGACLKELQRKLPRELREGDEALGLEDPKWISEVLGQVRPILLRRLLQRTDAS